MLTQSVTRGYVTAGYVNHDRWASAVGFKIASTRPIWQKGQRRRARVMPTGPGQRRPRKRDKRHKAAIAQLSCAVTGTPGPSEVAHVRFGDAAQGKPHTGMAEKPSDCWVVPLCAEMHRLNDDAQHGANERQWWEARGFDVLQLCRELYVASPEILAMEEILERHRQGALRSRKNAE